MAAEPSSLPPPRRVPSRPNAFIRFLKSPRFREGATFVAMTALMFVAMFAVKIPGFEKDQKIILSDLLLGVLALVLTATMLLHRLWPTKAGWTVIWGFILFTAYAVGVVLVSVSVGKETTSPSQVLRVVVPPMVLFLGIDDGLLSRRGLVRSMVATTTLLFALQLAHWVRAGAAAIKVTILGSSINYFLACSSLLLFASVYILLHNAFGRFWRALSYLNCILFAFLVPVAGSRTSFVVAVGIAAIFVAILASSGRRSLLAALAACAAVGLAAAAVVYALDFADAKATTDRLLSLFRLVPTPDSVEGSDFVRWEIWSAALESIRTSTRFWGGGRFLISIHGMPPTPAHNFIFELLIAVGAPGLGIFLATVGSALVHSVRTTTGWRNVSVILLPPLIYLGYGFFHPFITTGVFVNILFWTWMGIGLRNNVWKWEKLPPRLRRRRRRRA